MTSYIRSYGNLTAHQKPTTGDIKTSAAGVDHMGWLLCDGRSLSVTQYFFLFSIIKYSFGGSGTHFTLPNPAGRVAGAIGSGAGLTSRALGASLGEETHTLTIPEMPTHNHTGTTNSTTVGINDPGHIHTYINQSDTASPAANIITSTDVADNNQITRNTSVSTTGITTQPHVHTFTTNNTGGSNAHNNMQPTLFMGNMFIYSGKPTIGAYPYMSNNPYTSTTLIL